MSHQVIRLMHQARLADPYSPPILVSYHEEGFCFFVAYLAFYAAHFQSFINSSYPAISIYKICRHNTEFNYVIYL